MICDAKYNIKGEEVMNLKELQDIVIPAAKQALDTVEPKPESEKTSAIRVAEFEVMGEEFSIREQNMKKTVKNGQPSKFAKLAINGHQVSWLIRKKTDDWFLIVDGEHTAKEAVTDSGELNIQS